MNRQTRNESGRPRELTLRLAGIAGCLALALVITHLGPLPVAEHRLLTIRRSSRRPWACCCGDERR